MVDETPELPNSVQMPSDHRPGEQPRPRYERTDIAPRTIFTLMIASVVCGVMILAALSGLFQLGQQAFRNRNESRFPLAADRDPALPAPPRLEQLDRLAGDQLNDGWHQERARQERLTSFGPTEDAGFVHVPIDRAIEWVIDELPVRDDSPATGRDGGLVDSGEPNSGRMLRGALR